MKKIILSLFLFISVKGFCQTEFTIRDFYAQIERIVQEADEAIPADADPYGFHLTVRIVSKYSGSFADVFAPETLKQSVNKVISKHNFNRFNLDKPINYYINEDNKYLSMQVGLTPLNAADEEMAFQFKNFKVIQKFEGQSITHTVNVVAHFMIEKPKDGEISGNVFYQSPKGQALLIDRPFLSSGNEKKIVNQRFGPGDDNVNSGKPDNFDWKPFEANQSGYNFGELTPGHYFPHVKINGCIHHYDKPEKNNENEQIIKTYGDLHWDKDHYNDKVVRFDQVKAEHKDKVELHTTFSTRNTVEGFLIAPNEAPEKWNKWRDDPADFVKKEDTKIQKSKIKVYIEPYNWSSTFQFPRDTFAIEGHYIFHNVPSGVYLVYTENRKARGKIVEVCNCDKDGYEKRPDMTYQQNIDMDGYDIFLEYEYNNGGELFQLNALWENVTIAFGDDKTVPQLFSTATEPLKDSLGNYLDVEKRIIQPPFTMLEYPEYFICNDEFRICSDMLASENNPPAKFEIKKSGTLLSNVQVESDFDKDEGLYNHFTVEEYKRDIVLETGESVKKGVYFTWQFRFFTKVGGEKGADLHVEATPAFKWYEEKSEGGLPCTNIFGGGYVDALIPDQVIGLIHLGKDFTFSKTLKAGVKYSIRGEIEHKKQNNNTAPKEGEW